MVFKSPNSNYNPKTNLITSINTNSKFVNNKISNQRVLFTVEEDNRIKKFVDLFGTSRWNLVAQFMQRRTAKQCRDRYTSYLCPGFFQGEWSEEEDKLVIKMYKKYGSRWSLIQRSIPNRSANSIKNRWYYFLSKKVEQNDDVTITGHKSLTKNVNKTEIFHEDTIYDENKIIKNNDNVENENNSDDFDPLDQENEYFDLFNDSKADDSLLFFDNLNVNYQLI